MSPIARTPYDALPAALVEELAAAGLDARAVYDAVVIALEEDLPGDDVTSAATIPDTARGTGDFVAREPGVLAGMSVAALVFAYVMGDAVEISGRLADGTRVQRGDVVMSVSGPVRGLLTAERTALNYACHLSGVATATAAWVDALAGTRARVLDTRKTLPTYRALQKYAVRCGGGVNHRFSLSDMALVKDNHVVAAGGVLPAYRAVREAHPDLPVEVEVTDLDQLRALLDAGCDRILLDNMDSPTDGRGGADHRRPGHARGLGRAHLRPGPRGGRDRGRLHLGRRADPLGQGLRHRPGPAGAGAVTLLAVDIGNSHTLLGLLAGGEVVADWRVATDERRTSDEWAVLLRGLLGERIDDVTGIAVCSTVPAVLHEWREMLTGHFGAVPHVVVEPGVRTGVPVLMDNPREVGSDRIVNALAAATEYGGPAIVVDFGGTATTFDVVSAPGPVRRRRDRPGRRDLAGGARAARRAVAQGGIAATACGDREEHGGGFAVGNDFRGRRAGRGNCRPNDHRARRGNRRRPRDRHRLSRAAGARGVPVLHRPFAVVDAARPRAGVCAQHKRITSRRG